MESLLRDAQHTLLQSNSAAQRVGQDAAVVKECGRHACKRPHEEDLQTDLHLHKSLQDNHISNGQPECKRLKLTARKTGLLGAKTTKSCQKQKRGDSELDFERAETLQEAWGACDTLIASTDDEQSVLAAKLIRCKADIDAIDKQQIEQDVKTKEDLDHVTSELSAIETNIAYLQAQK